MKIVSRASRPGLLVGFLSILRNGFVLHGDFTLQSMITLAVLDAQINLTLSLITMSVSGFPTSFFLIGGTPRWCHKGTSCYTT